MKELCEKFAPATVCWFVKSVPNIVIEKNEKARVMSRGLFAAMVGTWLSNTHTIFTTQNTISASPGLQAAAGAGPVHGRPL